MQSLKELNFYFRKHTSEEPPVDLYETDENLVCEIDLPGMDPDDVQVSLFEDMLIIEGFRSEKRSSGECRYLCMERYLDSFRRIIKIPVAVDPLQGRAVYSQGVVSITFPKIKERVFRIEIVKQEGGANG